MRDRIFQYVTCSQECEITARIHGCHGSAVIFSLAAVSAFAQLTMPMTHLTRRPSSTCFRFTGLRR